MTAEKPDNQADDMLDRNLARALRKAVAPDDPQFRARLVGAVVSQARLERAKVRPRRMMRFAAAGALAAAAAVVAALLIYPHVIGSRPGPSIQPPSVAGEVRSIYGFTRVKSGSASNLITGTANLLAGQWITTAWGSRAGITLPDKSAIEAAGHTTVKVDEGQTGARLTLEEGSLSIAAAKQPAGKSLSIETPGAKVTVVGTMLDVHVFDKGRGVRETVVGVTEGRVNLASGGKTVPLPHGTYGVVTDSLPPVRRSFTREVNELADLKAETEKRAVGSGTPPGDPAIVDFTGDGSATVWLYVPVVNNTGAPMAKYTLQARTLVSGVTVFSAEDAPLPSRCLGSMVEVDLSEAPIAPGRKSYLVVKVPGVEGLFEERGKGTFAFSCDASPAPVVRLVELRLPDAATIRSVSPEPLSVRRALGRLVVTVSCNSRYPDVVR